MTATVCINGRIVRRKGLTLAAVTAGADWAIVGGYVWGLTETARKAALAHRD